MDTTPKGRNDSNGSSERPKRVASPKVIKKLSVSAFGSSSPASRSSPVTGTPKNNRSPKVVPDRRSPKNNSPITTEKKKKLPNKIPELELQVSKLQEDLKEVKEKLIASETSKEEAVSNAEELQMQLQSTTLKLEESQNKLSNLLASKESNDLELQITIENDDQDWNSQLETAREQQFANASTLASALDEINELKGQLEAKSDRDEQTKAAQANDDSELENMRRSLAQTCQVLETMKNEMRNSKESESRAHERARETLSQLQSAKQTVSELQFHRIKALDAYNTTRSELEQSRVAVEYLEELVRKLKSNNRQQHGRKGKDGEEDLDEDNVNLNENNDNDELEVELGRLRSEAGQLKYTLEAAEVRFRDEQEESSAQIKSAYEVVDQMKSQSGERLSNLESQLKEALFEIEELRANLMDKETELQGIVEENQDLVMKVNQQHQQLSSRPQVSELGIELERLKEEVSILKMCLVEKESEVEKLSKENLSLKSEIEERKNRDDGGAEITEEGCGGVEELAREVKESRVEEKEALEKLVVVTEEAEKSKKRAERAGEQLEAVQATMAGMEGELRRLKVQLDQWRKAAEAAAAMLSSTGGGGVGRRVHGGGRTDSNGYSPVGSPFMVDDYGVVEGYEKKKNGNVLKKIGGIWKKPQK